MSGKNIGRIAAAVLAVLLSAGASALAAETGIRYDEKTSVLTVEGTIGEEASGKYSRDVTIEIFNPGSGAVGDETPEDIKKALYCFYQVTPDEEGAFAFSAKIDGINGECLVRVRRAADGDYFEEKIFIASEKAYNDARDDINGQTSADGMRGAILKYADLYNFNHGILEELLKKDEKGGFLDSMAQYMLSMVKKAPYTDFKDITSDIDAELHMQKIMLWEDLETRLGLIEEYAQILSLTERKAYSEQYLKLSKEKKAETAELLEAAGPADHIGFKDKFFESLMLMRLNNISNWKDVGAVIADNSECMDRELYEEYKGKAGEHTRIHKAVADQKYKDFDRFIKVFTDAVEDGGSESGNGGGHAGGGSGGSGGGSGNGGNSGYYPLVKTDNSVTEPEKEEKITYNDLDGTEWAKESIYKLSEMKILSGRGDGAFAPQDNVTREEFVKMIVMAFQSYDSEAKCGFDDVKENDWYYPYVASAYTIGIVNGTDDKLFGTGRPVTRQDMAAICYRAARLVSGAEFKSSGNEAKLNDETEIADYASGAVNALLGAGIVQGTGSGSFEPLRSATRAEAAVMVYKLIMFTR